jgi:hypothetical protein
MMDRFWLQLLPSSDPAFETLHRAEQFTDPADWPVLERAHQQARWDAAWGADLATLETRAEALVAVAARFEERNHDGLFDATVHDAEVEALGYALGLTAARVAIRQHDQAQAGTQVAA